MFTRILLLSLAIGAIVFSGFTSVNTSSNELVAAPLCGSILNPKDYTVTYGDRPPFNEPVYSCVQGGEWCCP